MKKDTFSLLMGFGRFITSTNISNSRVGIGTTEFSPRENNVN